ncbi:hypothetical protein FCU94_04500 [Vibrio sp. JPW-9-11-11]|nr:hypothetical protein [Vibrio sp. JPW-9-11-11]
MLSSDECELGLGKERGEVRKKCRGMAGGTIPRVPMTPSLAAGVVRWAPPLEFNVVVLRG